MNNLFCFSPANIQLKFNYAKIILKYFKFNYAAIHKALFSTSLAIEFNLSST